jgi:PTH1 family peptidyl-tRNA hydrolase
VVVGLGNPGEEYRATRHNAGFMALDTLAGRLTRFGGWKSAKGDVRGEGRAGRHTLLLVKPQRYMNRSGEAIRGLLTEGWITPEILVVCDDVYLPLGAIRLRARGGSGGHQGLESIRDATGTDEYPRLRIGVGPAPPSADLPEYVLDPFAEDERDRLTRAIEAAAGCAFDAGAEGLVKAMNRWNRFDVNSTEE